MSSLDVAVIGAGPAGLAAAATAASAGLSVVLLDAADRPGGQYYRHQKDKQPQRLRAFIRDVDYKPAHRVWAVEEGFTVHALAGERDRVPVEIEARSLVIATGAHDRSLPFPGWDLPGVMTAGGAQALLKGNGVRPGRRIVVAGTGPFLLPVAAGLAPDVVGVYEANRRAGIARRPWAVPPRKALEGARYMATLARHRIPFRWGHAVVAAHGDGQVAAVTVARLDRDWRPVAEQVVECDAVAVGYGFTPQLELPLQLGCATRTDAGGSLVLAVDAGQRTSVPDVYAAGETTGVAGVDVAAAEGERAGLAVAGIEPRGPAAARFTALLHDAYQVRDGWMTWLRDDTLICRCEEVRYSRLVEAVDLGAVDARAVKLLSRAGMGWCQGRVCGYATACLTARLTGGTPDLAGLSSRPIAQPVRLGDLAGERTEMPNFQKLGVVEEIEE